MAQCRRHVVGHEAALPERVLRRGRRCRSAPLGRIRDRGAVADGPDPVVALHAHGVVHRDPALVGQRQPQLPDQGRRPHPRRPAEQPRGDDLARGERDPVRLGGLEERAGTDLDPAPA